MQTFGTLTRRRLLALAGSSLASAPLLGALPRQAHAQDPYGALKGIDLECLVWDGGTFVDSMIAGVQEKWTGVGGGKLNVRKVPFGELDRAVRSANQGGRGPDIFLANAPNVITYVNLGLIEPVTDMFTEEDLRDFFPVGREGSEINGEFYGPSTNENGQALYYDKRLTDRYGIKPPETLADAWSWDEAIEIFSEIQKGERSRRGTDQFWALYPNMGNTGMFFSGIYPRSAGEKGSNAWKMVSDDGRTSDGYLNDPEALKGLQLMQDIHHKHAIAPLARQKDLFYNDQVAFFQGVPLYYGPIRKSRPDIELGTTPVPFIKTPIIHTGSFAWLVNRETPKMEEAKLFVKFMGSPEANDVVARGWTSPPIRRSMIADRPEFNEKPLSLFIDSIEEWSVPRPLTPGFSEYDAVWAQLEADIVNGGDVPALTNEAVRRIDAQLRRY